MAIHFLKPIIQPEFNRNPGCGSDMMTDKVRIDTLSADLLDANNETFLARQAEFEGKVTPGCEYVLVDDFVGMGGTLANLKGYIESQGGRVLAAVALTGRHDSAKLAPSPERLQKLREKHGTELENWWFEHFAHHFDALTESEARYLARTETADTIRNRIAEAEQKGDRPAVS